MLDPGVRVGRVVSRKFGCKSVDHKWGWVECQSAVSMGSPVFYFSTDPVYIVLYVYLILFILKNLYYLFSFRPFVAFIMRKKLGNIGLRKQRMIIMAG